MSDCLLTTTLLTKKNEIDNVIRDTIDKVLVLRFGRASDPLCLHLDDILSKSAREVSKFSTIALVDIDSEDVQVYVNYFDITLVPATVFFFNAHHMKMDSGTADHTKWVGAFHRKQDFIDVVEAIFRAAMKGKLIANCPLPPERITKYELLYKDLTVIEDGDPIGRSQLLFERSCSLSAWQEQWQRFSSLLQEMKSVVLAELSLLPPTRSGQNNEVHMESLRMVQMAPRGSDLCVICPEQKYKAVFLPPPIE
ncbi:hypothetical protein OIU85_001585 [Salix viminalis]|uniref:Thioredoxin-like protein 4B n=1 Tax=Salix viminalis TaxID=40686 RepID=A0A9Q0ZY85_SALVM|nr:hypothetical protein OIU85_001585 [Salix viminalis]